MGFWLAYLHFTVAHDKVQGQGHAHVDSISKMVTDRANITITMKYEVAF